MNIIDIQLLRANDERAAIIHEERVEELHEFEASCDEAYRRRREKLAAALAREARAEANRLKVRELMKVFFDSEQTGGLPLDELLVGVINYAAGTLDLMELDEPAGLKVRRIGRLMQTEKIVF